MLVSLSSTEVAKGAELSLQPAAPDSLKPPCSDPTSKADITEKKVIIHLGKKGATVQ